MLRKSWAVALLMLPLSALAAEGVSYNYIEGNYIVDEEVDVSFGGLSGSDDGDGFAVGASFALGEMLFVNGNYTDASLDDSGLDLQFLNVGLGAHTSQWTGAWDLFGVVSYEDVDFDVADEDGFGVAAGLRGMLSDAIELNGQVKYVDISDADGITFKIGGLYKLNNWGITADYATGDLEGGGFEVDTDEIRVGLRFIFG